MRLTRRRAPGFLILIITLFVPGLHASWNKDPDWLTVPNEGKSQLLTRHPRFLVFSNSGIIKLIVGFTIPVDLRKRTLVWLTNIQFQYFTPVNYTQLFPVTYNKRRSTDDALSVKRIDRNAIYEVMRMMLERKGIGGRACILRAICQAAETPLYHNGLVGEIMHILFTPDTSKSSRSRFQRGTGERRFREESLGEEFFRAQLTGEAKRRRSEAAARVSRSSERVDEGSTFDADVCHDGFPSCPSSILDMVSVLLEG